MSEPTMNDLIRAAARVQPPEPDPEPEPTAISGSAGGGNQGRAVVPRPSINEAIRTLFEDRER